VGLPSGLMAGSAGGSTVWVNGGVCWWVYRLGYSKAPYKKTGESPKSIKNNFPAPAAPLRRLIKNGGKSIKKLPGPPAPPNQGASSTQAPENNFAGNLFGGKNILGVKFRV
jgi:hypothetical protein